MPNTVIFSKSSGLNDDLYGNSLAPIRGVIEENVESFRAMSIIDKVYYLDTSKNFAEKYTAETALGDFEDVGENGAYPKTSSQESYSLTVEPTTWKSSFEATREMVEDANFGKLKSRANIFATSYNRTREKYATGLLAGGIGSSVAIGGRSYSTLCADGQPLFSKAHPSITGGYDSQSNLFTGAFSLSVLDAMQEKMQDFRDDNGNLLNLAPDTILIPNVAPLKRAVFEAIGSELDPTSTRNACNFQLGLWNVIISPYLPRALGNQPYFFLLDSRFNQDYMCLPWVDRLPLTVHTDRDPNTDACVWRGRARFGAGFNNWRSIAVCGEGLTGTALVSTTQPGTGGGTDADDGQDG